MGPGYSTDMRSRTRSHLFLAACLLVGCAAAPADRSSGEAGDDRPPNVIVFFADDMGYADLSCFGSEVCSTPRLDELAREGMRWTDFYSASPGCSPSRAALLTGCYPQRVGMPTILGPSSSHGLNPSETTIAELLRDRGYATAMVGKWHLGFGAKHLMPLEHGFDEYFGLPYSNDMWPYHYGDQDRGLIGNPNWPDLPVIDGHETVELNPRQESLTPRYTERALDFIDRSADRPFFLYFAYSHPHVPIAASDAFRGRTGKGLYADMVAEIDDSVGQVVDRLREHGIDDETLIIFTSDNGPWTRFGNHAGSTGPLRGDKGTTFEGGMRMPCVAWWPGRIPAGTVCREVATTMDVLPTVAALAGAGLPELKIDGHDIRPLLFGEDGATSPTDAFYYYWPGELQAVRVGNWKLHVPHEHRTVEEAGHDGTPGRQGKARIELSLFDLASDPGESVNLADSRPEVVAELMQLIERARADLGDTGTNNPGTGRRPSGRRDR